MTQIAILADVHFHDVYGDYDFEGPVIPRAGRRANVRTLKDTVSSTRIFNENYFALFSVLDDLAARNIKHVVLVGDYSDDGQRATVAGLKVILDRYREQHGMAFYATIGNHDVRTPVGGHHDKRFLNADGSHTLTTSSSSMKSSGSQVVTDKMFGLGYRDAMLAMADAGLFPQEHFLHWETPFGTDGDLARREFEITSEDGRNTRKVIDASYLVEPFDGTWLVAIDANVYVPKDGSFSDDNPKGYVESTDAGWNAMVQHKSFILDWLADVERRAKASGKKLLVLSHYPVVDFLRGTVAEETALFGSTGFTRRSPTSVTSDAFAKTGVLVHFSGHLHVNALGFHEGERGTLVNIAMPSLVGYPPAYKIVSLGDGEIKIETVVIRDVPHFDDFLDLYRQEVAHHGDKESAILGARNYYEFVRAHMTELVDHRYLPKEWPHEWRPLVERLNGRDLVTLSRIDEPLEVEEVFARLRQEEASSDSKRYTRVTFKEMVVDWYRLRHASDLAFSDIDTERAGLYGEIVGILRQRKGKGGLQGQLALFAEIMRAYLEGPPSIDIAIDTATGTVRSLGASGRISSVVCSVA
ncbi:metallophosphoesterase [Microvirga sp. 2MCAF38]|uniref:metallophosphoesterase family protein n=1 Tax=Microvirga sp. 2MCAF38 TaxID=3232989 RepID=UPI003F9779CD